MKSKVIHNLLRALIALLGAGAGVALNAGLLQLIRVTMSEETLSIPLIVAAYVVFGLVFGGIFLLLSERIIRGLARLGSELVNYIDKVPATQLMPALSGLIAGLAIAALLTPVLGFMGSSIFTVAAGAILYVILGMLGYTIGRRRSADFMRLFLHMFNFRGKKIRRKKTRRSHGTGCVILDTSVLIDGRLVGVAEAGFLTETLVLPAFVTDELRRLADTADATKKAQGQRALETVQRLQGMREIQVTLPETDYTDTADIDVKLLRMAREAHGALLTCDQNLNKAASVSGIRVLNIDRLAGALRQAVHAGDSLTVRIVKEGREPGQGVAFLEDGTMVVVENGRSRLGEEIAVTVTSALQTSAGRMVFARQAE